MIPFSQLIKDICYKHNISEYKLKHLTRKSEDQMIYRDAIKTLCQAGFGDSSIGRVLIKDHTSIRLQRIKMGLSSPFGSKGNELSRNDKPTEL